MEISSAMSSYRNTMVQERFTIQTMKDSQDITSQSVEKLLSSVEQVSNSVSKAALMPGVGNRIDVYA